MSDIQTLDIRQKFVGIRPIFFVTNWDVYVTIIVTGVRHLASVTKRQKDMNDQSFDPSKLTMTNGITPGYQRRPRHLVMKTLVTLVTVGSLSYLVYGYVV